MKKDDIKLPKTKIVLALFRSMILWYPIFSLVLWDLNIASWSLFARFSWIVLSLFSWGAAVRIEKEKAANKK